VPTGVLYVRPIWAGTAASSTPSHFFSWLAVRWGGALAKTILGGISLLN